MTGTLVIRGAGWLSMRGYGAMGLGYAYEFRNGETFQTVAREGIFPRPVKNFGRLDRVSRITLAAASLALRDGGIVPTGQEIGIVGTNDAGSLVTDTEYLRDYLDNGRKLSRANLFIYTLPSSPLGEVAIYSGLTGPLLYVQDQDELLVRVLTTAGGIVGDGGADCMLAGMTRGDEGIYFVVGRGEEAGLCSLEEAAKVALTETTVSGLVARMKNIIEG